MLTPQQSAKLVQIANRSTLYELVAINGARTILLQYAAHKGRSKLLSSVHKMGKELVALTGATEIQLGKKSGDPATLGEWTIKFSGRTQREAIIEGEHPFIPAAGQ